MAINTGTIYADFELRTTNLTKQMAEIESKLKRFTTQAKAIMAANLDATPDVNTKKLEEKNKQLTRWVKSEADNRALHEFLTNQKTSEDYIQHLQKRQQGFKEYSSGWMRLQGEMRKIGDAADKEEKKRAEESKRLLENQHRYQTQLRDKDLLAHRKWISDRMGAEKQYSTEYMRLAKERERTDKQLHDEARRRDVAARKDRQAAEADALKRRDARRELAEGVGRAGIMGGIALGGFDLAALKTGATFDDAIRYAQQNLGGKGNRDLIQQGVMRVANDPLNRKTPTEVAQALYQTLSTRRFQGVTAQGDLLPEAYEMLRIASLAGTASSSETKYAVSPITAAVLQHLKGAETPTLAADKIFKGILMGQMEFPELGNLGQVFQYSKANKVPIDDTMSALAWITSTGTKTDSGITFLKNFLMHMQHPSERARVSSAALGYGPIVDGKHIGFTSTTISEMGGLVPFFEDLRARLKAYGATHKYIPVSRTGPPRPFDAEETLKHLIFPEMRSETAASILMDKGDPRHREGLRSYAEDMRANYRGSLQMAARQMIGGPGSSFDSVAKSFQSIQISLSTGLAGMLEGFAKALKNVADSMSKLDPNIQKGIGTTAGMGAIGLGVMGVAGFAFSGLGKFVDLLKDSGAVGGKISTLTTALGGFFRVLIQVGTHPLVIAAFGLAKGVEWGTEKSMGAFDKAYSTAAGQDASPAGLRSQRNILSQRLQQISNPMSGPGNWWDKTKGMFANALNPFFDPVAERQSIQAQIAQIDEALAYGEKYGWSSSRRSQGIPYASSMRSDRLMAPRGSRNQTTHYGWAGDPNSDSNSARGIGAWNNRLRQGSVALRPADVKRLGLQKGEKVRALLLNGSFIEGYYDDHLPDNGVGRFDIYDPQKRFGDYSGLAIRDIVRVSGAGGAAAGGIPPEGKHGPYSFPTLDKSKSELAAERRRAAAIEDTKKDTYHASHDSYDNALYDANLKYRQRIASGVPAHLAEAEKKLAQMTALATLRREEEKRRRKYIADREAKEKREKVDMMRSFGVGSKEMHDYNKMKEELGPAFNLDEYMESYRSNLGAVPGASTAPTYSEWTTGKKQEVKETADALKRSLKEKEDLMRMEEEIKRDDYYSRETDPSLRKRFVAEQEYERDVRTGTPEKTAAWKRDMAIARIDTEGDELAQKATKKRVGEETESKRISAITDEMRKLQRIASETKRTLTGIFEDFLTTGKVSFKSILEEFKRMLIHMIASAAAARITDKLFGYGSRQGQSAKEWDSMGNVGKGGLLQGVLQGIGAIKKGDKGKSGGMVSLPVPAGGGTSAGGLKSWGDFGKTFGGGKGIRQGENDAWKAKVGDPANIGLIANALALGGSGDPMGALMSLGGMFVGGPWGMALGALGGLGIGKSLKKIFRFDDPINDRAAVRWGADFAKFFAQGAQQGSAATRATAGRTGASGGTASGAPSIHITHVGNVNSVADVQAMHADWGYHISRQMPVVTPGV